MDANFEGSYTNVSDLALSEALLYQECIYQSLQRNSQSGHTNARAGSRPQHDRLDSSRGRNSFGGIFMSHIASDEALARQFQELEDRDTAMFYSEHSEAETDTSLVNGGSSSINISAQIDGKDDVDSDNITYEVNEHDDIDPDNMTYEEICSLEESVGDESKGLSEEAISSLPSFTYKTGFFSRKGKYDQCVICVEAYKKRDRLVKLPCKHHFHQECIANWLKINKVCPVCMKEVYES